MFRILVALLLLYSVWYKEIQATGSICLSEESEFN